MAFGHSNMNPSIYVLYNVFLKAECTAFVHSKINPFKYALMGHSVRT